MVEVLRSTHPTARVEHKCQTCTRVIAPGEKYERQVCAYDGRVYDWVTCSDCIALFPSVWDWVAFDDEGIGQEDYDEWSREHVNDEKHRALARAHLVRRGLRLPEWAEPESVDSGSGDTPTNGAHSNE